MISFCTAVTSWLTQTSLELVALLVVTALFETFAVLFEDVETSLAPLTNEWVDVLLAEDWPLTIHWQTLVRGLAARLGRGDVLRLTTSQNSQNASPYLTSPLNVLRSVAEQAEEVSVIARWGDMI